MTTLERTQRQQLEKVIQEARDVAEIAASAVLNEFGVGDATAPVHLDKTTKDLRRRLRIHGRQLGDLRDTLSKTQETVRLKEEIAYEHWHRMLFARFLAENDLLMYPDENNPIPVTLEECEELAIEQGLNNGWEVAAQYAAKMLPQIFRLTSPVFELKLPKNRLRQLEQLLASLSQETFLASDSLGWVYQFWQAKRKDEVNASEVKIGARELPAVTQLFTEDYMVSFLLDNSLGAWWAAKKLGIIDEKVGVEAESEDELRQRASIPGVPLEYLRFIQLANGNWIPSAGIFEHWTQDIRDFKILDPSCGSGHFLIALFSMLVPLRENLESITEMEAIQRVIRENIFGLEIDQRCVELAAFAIALTAWTYSDENQYFLLPFLNIACCGLPITSKRDEWLKLAEHDINLKSTLNTIYDHFAEAPVLGSLLDLTSISPSNSIFDRSFDEIAPIINDAVKENDNFKYELGVVAQGTTKAASILSLKYNWVITNVPYLSRSAQCDTLRLFCDKYYPDAKHDLANVFLERCLRFLLPNGIVQLVMPQNWLFLGRYKKHRQFLLKTTTCNNISILGPGAFSSISGEVVKGILITITKMRPEVINRISGIDVSEQKTVSSKIDELSIGKIVNVAQKAQFKNPDSRILLTDQKISPLLNNHADSRYGLRTADTQRFIFKFWEIGNPSNDWIPHQSTVMGTEFYAGKEHLLRWENGSGGLHSLADKGIASLQGSDAWRKTGVAISLTGELRATIYTGDKFDNNCAAVWSIDINNIAALWSFCSRPEYNQAVRLLDKNLKVTNATLLKVPFDLEYWTKVANDQYTMGLPKPFSDDATQWIFHGDPSGSVIWDEDVKWTTNGKLRTDDTVLQIAVARLLGYRWPAELDPEMELADEQREWVDKCDELLPLADEDGIVCIPSVRGEATAADRLLKMLVRSYGDKWNNQILSDLLSSVSAEGKTLDTWLRDSFFTQHNKLFKHRPFIWHLWDGLVDGFSVLVNYHKLDQKLLETLIYDYLGDWISRQKRDITQLISGAEEKLAAAEVLKKRLELILAGEQPYDIFVRWKSVDQQCIGWDPDLNDGVRLNIRPFMSVPDIKKRGAGVLRDKPNIHWKKDRGKDVVTAPWYNLGPEYDGKEGDRINDHHLNLAEKKNAKNPE